MKWHRPTLLLAEHDNKSLKDSTNKALTAAKALGGDVHILVAGKDAKAVADGVKEGWNRNQPLDINKATKDQLQSLPGMSAEGAERIIDGRPYSSARRGRRRSGMGRSTTR